MRWELLGALVRGGFAVPSALPPCCSGRGDASPSARAAPVGGVDPSNRRLRVAALVLPSTARLAGTLTPAWLYWDLVSGGLPGSCLLCEPGPAAVTFARGQFNEL